MNNNIKLTPSYDKWEVQFTDHKPLMFNSKESVIAYIGGENTKEHGWIEYERVPTKIIHHQEYDWEWVEENS